MKSYFCKRLYEEINFDAENIYVCCGKSLGPSYKVPERNPSAKYLNDLIKWKQNCAKQAYLGEVSTSCLGCCELQEQEISKQDYLKAKFFNTKKFPIRNIIVKTYRQCELSCLYCLERKYTKGQKTTVIEKSNFYDFLPIAKELIKKNLIDKYTRLEIQGGSFTVWDEFLKILDLFVKFGIKDILYHTNAVKFVPEIADAASKINSQMSISIDSGCEETYLKIKGENKFNEVLENIVKYADASVQCSVKYIISKNLNDNIEEIKKFGNIIKELKERTKFPHKISTMLDIDFRESLSSSDYAVPEEYISMFKYMKDFCEKNNIDIGYQDFIKNKLEI